MLDGVLLCSGGFDSLAFGAILVEAGFKIAAVYCSHRPNVGNVTKKEIRAAALFSEKVLERRLLILKAPAKGTEPTWWCEFGDVAFTQTMPVPKAQKHLRNRRFMAALRQYDLDKGIVAIGLLGTNERTPKNRLADEEHDLLKRNVRGELLTPEAAFGFKGKLSTKADLLRCVGKNKAIRKIIWASSSCRLYFRKHCGTCNSCKERASAFMAAWGEDKTVYRKGTVADRIKHSMLDPIFV